MLLCRCKQELLNSELSPSRNHSALAHTAAQWLPSGMAALFRVRCLIYNIYSCTGQAIWELVNHNVETAVEMTGPSLNGVLHAAPT